MSYKMGEGVLDNTYSKENIARGVKSNIRFFIDSIIVGIVGLLFGALSCIGGCFGCSSCIETAACVDSCMESTSCGCSCDYESITTENYLNSGCADDDYYEDGDDYYEDDYYYDEDDTGCSSDSEEDKDDTGCGAAEEISIFVYNGDDEDSFTLSEDQTYFTCNSTKNPTYYQFLGLYDSPIGGTQYVDANGNVLEELEDGLVLYAQYHEYGTGETYTLEFNLAPHADKFGGVAPTFAPVTVTVGGDIDVSMWPTVPETEGYDFAGWYSSDSALHGNVVEGAKFHLSDFGINPSSESRTQVLSAHFVPKMYKINFSVNDSTYTIEAAYGSTYEGVFDEFDRLYSWLIQEPENFFGWGVFPDSAPTEAINKDTLIETNNVILYPIIREPIFFEFHFNDQNNRIEQVRFYEDATNVVLEEVEELAVVLTEDAYPGYRFRGWYATEQPVENEQPVQVIEKVEQETTLYARWDVAYYTITYYAKDQESGITSQVRYNGEGYQMSDTTDGTPVELWSGVERQVGYTFAGWTENEDGVLGVGETAMTSLSNTYGTKALYAVFAPHVYTVSLPAGAQDATIEGGRSVTVDITHGVEQQLPVPVRPGYDFVGWKYQDDTMAEAAICSDSEGNLLGRFSLPLIGLDNTYANEERLTGGFGLLPVYAIRKYTVTFYVPDDYDGEGWVRYQEPVEVEHGSSLMSNGEFAVPNPTKTGYNFVDWRYDDLLVHAFNTTSAITENLELYAKFTIKSYEVKLYYRDKASNTERSTTKSVDHGTLLSAVVAASERENFARRTAAFKLLGWYEEREYLTSVSETVEITEGLTLYAKYQDSIRFTFNDAASSDTTRRYFAGERIGQTVGDTTVPTLPVATKNGYDFVGWYDNEECYGSALAQDTLISDSTPTTYWPKFETVTYNINYYKEPIDRANMNKYAMGTYTIEAGNVLIGVAGSTSIAPAPTKDGYTFVGWKELNATGSTVGEVLTDLTGLFKNIDLCAVWTANEYTVTLANEGDGVEVPVTYDSGFNFGTPTLEKDGYDFLGWSWNEPYYPTNQDATNLDDIVLITDATGASLANVIYSFTGNATAYPVFQLKTYDVYWYDAANTSQELFKTTVKHFATVSEWLDAGDAKTGYSLVGFYQDASCVDTFVFDTDAVTSGPIHVYIAYEINYYEVTFEINAGGTQLAPITVVYNGSLSDAISQAFASAEFENYVDTTNSQFLRWVDGNGMVYDTSSSMPAHDLELFAVYDMPTYIEFVKHDGDTVTYGPYYNGDSYAEYTYNRDGYTFNGWYIGNTRFDFSGVADGTENVFTVTASWTANTYNIYYYVEGSLIETGSYTMDQTEQVNLGHNGYMLYTPVGGNMPAGYEFDGWYTSSSCTGTAIETLDNTAGVTYCGDVYLYGQYSPIEYTIRFKVDGITSDTTYTFHYGDALTNIDMTDFVGTASDHAGEHPEYFTIQDSTTHVIEFGEWNSGYSTYVWTEDIVLVAGWY